MAQIVRLYTSCYVLGSSIFKASPRRLSGSPSPRLSSPRLTALKTLLGSLQHCNCSSYIYLYSSFLVNSVSFSVLCHIFYLLLKRTFFCWKGILFILPYLFPSRGSTRAILLLWRKSGVFYFIFWTKICINFLSNHFLYLYTI